MNDQKVWQRAVLERRAKAGMTQEQLAARSGLSSRTICELENGRAVPRESTLQLLGRALGMSPAETSQLAAAARTHRFKPSGRAKAY
jgi:transcriptional regulator with XRE-family HTH domain